jgi:multidrug efflux pump subunit AcrA (membrane-fusion protein)
VTLQRTDAGHGAELNQRAVAGSPEDLLPMDDGEDSRLRARKRLTRRARWVLIIGIVVLLAGGGVGAWAIFFRTPAAQTTLRTITVSNETLKQTVSATGTLNPATESDLSFSSSGTVTSVKVGAGDTVKKGQKLAAIDDSTLQIDYESAKASLTEAKQSRTEVEDNADSTAAAIAAAKATVKVKRNAVLQARAALKAATLVSPIDGTVAEVTIAKGDIVSGGSSSTGSTGSTGSGSTGSGSGSTGSTGSTGSGSTGSGSTGSGSTSTSAAITVISTGTFTVTTSVSNADVTSIKKGLQATITPTGSTDPVFGTVSSVGVVASTSSSSSSSGSGSATFPVTIKVTGTHKHLLAGSSVTVAITVKQLTNVLSVPTQAITTVGGKTVVQKLVNGKQVQTEVKLGAVMSAATVITSGLKAGDQVVLASFRIPNANGTGTRNGTGGGQGGQFGGGGFRVPGQGQGQFQQREGTR